MDGGQMATQLVTNGRVEDTEERTPRRTRVKAMDQRDVADQQSTEEISSHAFQMPTVVESILKFLPAKDLYSCAKTCRLWYAIANSIKKRRCHARPRIVLFEEKTTALETAELHRYMVYTFIKGFSRYDLQTLLRERVKSLWEEPYTAIRFLTPYTSEVDYLLEKIRKIKEENCSEDLGEARKELKIALEKARAEILWVRACLPQKCRILQVPVEISCPWTRCREGGRCFPAMMLFPNISEFEAIPFAVPDEENLDFKEYQSIFLSGEPRGVQSDIKFFIVFSGCYRKVTFLKTAFEKHINDDTFMVMAQQPHQSLSTGILFAGKRIRVKVAAFLGKQCCMRYHLSQMREASSYGNSVGMIFIQIPDWVRRYDSHDSNNAVKLYSKHFPQSIAFLVNDFRYLKTDRSDPIPVVTCENCDVGPREDNYQNIVRAVFVTFERTVLEANSFPI